MYLQERHLVAKSGTQLDPFALSSDDPTVEVSSGHKWYNVMSD